MTARKPNADSIGSYSVAQAQHARQDDDTSFDLNDLSTLSAMGDMSLSEAYNIPAPTTGNYPLRPKRERPPMPRNFKRPSRLDIPASKEDVSP